MRDRFKASMLAISLVLGGLVAFMPLNDAIAEENAFCDADLSFASVTAPVKDDTTLVGQSEGAATYPQLGSLALVKNGESGWNWYYGVTHSLESKKLVFDITSFGKNPKPGQVYTLKFDQGIRAVDVPEKVEAELPTGKKEIAKLHTDDEASQLYITLGKDIDKVINPKATIELPLSFDMNINKAEGLNGATYNLSVTACKTKQAVQTVELTVPQQKLSERLQSGETIYHEVVMNNAYSINGKRYFETYVSAYNNFVPAVQPSGGSGSNNAGSGSSNNVSSGSGGSGSNNAGSGSSNNVSSGSGGSGSNNAGSGSSNNVSSGSGSFSSGTSGSGSSGNGDSEESTVYAEQDTDSLQRVSVAIKDNISNSMKLGNISPTVVIEIDKNSQDPVTAPSHTLPSEAVEVPYVSGDKKNSIAFKTIKHSGLVLAAFQSVVLSDEEALVAEHGYGTNTVGRYNNIVVDDRYKNMTDNSAPLTAGKASATVDQKSLVRGVAFVDANANDRYDLDEELLLGITVVLTKADDPEFKLETLTNELGEYEFSDLENGKYQVSFTVPEAYKPASKVNGQADSKEIVNDLSVNEAGSKVVSNSAYVDADSTPVITITNQQSGRNLSEDSMAIWEIKIANEGKGKMPASVIQVKLGEHLSNLLWGSIPEGVQVISGDRMELSELKPGQQKTLKVYATADMDDTEVNLTVLGTKRGGTPAATCVMGQPQTIDNYCATFSHKTLKVKKHNRQTCEADFPPFGNINLGRIAINPDPAPGTGGDGSTQPPAPGTGGDGSTQPPAPGTGGDGSTQPPAPGTGGDGSTQPPAPGTGGDGSTQPPAPGTGGDGSTQPPTPGTGDRSANPDSSTDQNNPATNPESGSETNNPDNTAGNPDTNPTAPGTTTTVATVNLDGSDNGAKATVEKNQNLKPASAATNTGAKLSAQQSGQPQTLASTGVSTGILLLAAALLLLAGGIAIRSRQQG